jgi:hypothetical protein
MNSMRRTAARTLSILTQDHNGRAGILGMMRRGVWVTFLVIGAWCAIPQTWYNLAAHMATVVGIFGRFMTYTG